LRENSHLMLYATFGCASIHGPMAASAAFAQSSADKNANTDAAPRAQPVLFMLLAHTTEPART
jgi:hypothetical protein